jgi:hypothetical protein
MKMYIIIEAAPYEDGNYYTEVFSDGFLKEEDAIKEVNRRRENPYKHEYGRSVSNFLGGNMEQELVKIVAKINDIIDRTNHHSKTANHFYHLKMRLIDGKKLTKKMQENLGWIKKEIL